MRGYLVCLSLAAAAAMAFGQEGENLPPRLKRGKPQAGDARGEAPPDRKSQPPLREIVTDADGNVISGGSATTPGRAIANSAESGGDPIIEKARAVMDDVQSKIPNFLCDQLTLRYTGEGWPKPQWKLKDRFTAEVMFVDGAESYRNVKSGSKLAKVPVVGRGKNDPEKTGQWSRNDWMTTFLDVLANNTDAQFKPDGEEPIGGRAAWRYRLRVRQSNSHWRIMPEGEELRPAYRGRIWIDKEMYRVLRLEMEAIEIPSTFPWHVVEMTTELGVVSIAGENFLLPIQSENLSCQRDTVTCNRNEVQFRNYRRFTAESTISTTDSSVKYEEEPATPAAAPPPPAAKRTKKK